MSLTYSGIYCDDIRREAGNKASLMGCYSEILYLPSFPARATRLCHNFIISGSKEDLPESAVIVVKMGDKELIRLDFDIESKKNPSDLEIDRFTLNGGFNFDNLEFPEPVIISSYLLAGENEYPGPYLKVLEQPKEP